MKQYVKIEKMNKKLSTKTFIISQILIVIIALYLIGWLAFYLNYQEKPAKKFSMGAPITSEPASLTLDVTTPDDDLLVFDKEIEISGKTGPNMFVLISSDSNDLVIQAKQDGSFSSNFKLDSGINDLKVIAFDKNGDQKEVQRTVYFSREKI